MLDDQTDMETNDKGKTLVKIITATSEIVKFPSPWQRDFHSSALVFQSNGSGHLFIR